MSSSTAPDGPRAEAALVDEIAAVFPELRAVRVAATAPGTYAVYAMVEAALLDPTLARRLVGELRRRGWVVFPALFAQGEWPKATASAVGEAGRGESFVAEVGAWLRDGRAPALIERVREARLRLSELGTWTRLPSGTLHALCAELVRDVFTLLFALQGRVFVGSADDMRFCEEVLVPAGALVLEDVTLFHELSGLAHRERALDAVASGRRFPPPLPLTRVSRMLRHAQRFVERRATPPRVRKRRRLVAIVLAGAATVGGVVAFLLGRIPIEPVDAAKITQVGGIVGRYFAGRNHEKEVLRRVDTAIDFSSAGGRIVPELGGQDYSARWEGYLFFASSGPQRVCVVRDDGARLEVGGRRLVDAWGESAPTKACGDLHARRGWHTLRLDYFQGGGNATIRLLFEEGGRQRPVKAEELCCTK